MRDLAERALSSGGSTTRANSAWPCGVSLGDWSVVPPKANGHKINEASSATTSRTTILRSSLSMRLGIGSSVNLSIALIPYRFAGSKNTYEDHKCVTQAAPDAPAIVRDRRE